MFIGRDPDRRPYFDILVYQLSFYEEHPLEALNWWAGGMASHGVLLGGLTGVFLFCRLRRKPFVETADEVSVAAAFVMGVGPSATSSKAV